jgi:hypothetical protein
MIEKQEQNLKDQPSNDKKIRRRITGMPLDGAIIPYLKRLLPLSGAFFTII